MIKVFQYLPELDAFLCTPEFVEIVEYLGLAEWTPCVWVCRYLILDNDYGEHVFDQWDERDARKEKAEAMGIEPNDLLIVTPDIFQNGKDGPCHSNEMRKRFWTDVCKSLELSMDLIADEARGNNKVLDRERYPGEPDYYIPNLEERIVEMRNKHEKC